MGTGMFMRCLGVKGHGTKVQGCGGLWGSSKMANSGIHALGEACPQRLPSNTALINLPFGGALSALRM